MQNYFSPNVVPLQNAKLLKAWKSVLESYNTKPGREKALIVTAKDDLNTTMDYFDAGVTIVRVTPLSESGASLTESNTSLAERMETKLKNANSNFKRIGWMVSFFYFITLKSIISSKVYVIFFFLQLMDLHVSNTCSFFFLLKCHYYFFSFILSS